MESICNIILYGLVFIKYLDKYPLTDKYDDKILIIFEELIFLYSIKTEMKIWKIYINQVSTFEFI